MTTTTTPTAKSAKPNRTRLGEFPEYQEARSRLQSVQSALGLARERVTLLETELGPDLDRARVEAKSEQILSGKPATTFDTEKDLRDATEVAEAASLAHRRAGDELNRVRADCSRKICRALQPHHARLVQQLLTAISGLQKALAGEADFRSEHFGDTTSGKAIVVSQCIHAPNLRGHAPRGFTETIQKLNLFKITRDWNATGYGLEVPE